MMSFAARPAALSADDLLRGLWRYKFLILLVTVLTGLATYAVVSRLTPYYSAEGLIVLDTREITIPELRTALGGQRVEPATVQTELQVLRSHSLAEQVVLELGLHEHPDVVEELQNAQADWCDRLNVRAYLPASVCGTPSGYDPAARQVDPVQFTVGTLRKNLSVYSDGESYALHVAFLSPDPRLSAQVVNTLMDTYVTNQIIAKQRESEDANQFLTERLAELQRAVEQADRRVNEFRNQNELVETREGSLIDQRLIEVNRQLSEARGQLAEAQARFSRAQESVRAGGAAGATSDVVSSPRIQNLFELEATLLRRQAELSVDLGPRHPLRQSVEAELADVRNNINAEIDRAVRALQSEVNVARSRVASLENSLGELEASSSEKGQAYATLAQLEREAEAARDLYATFFERVQQTARPSGVDQANARVVSRAVPPLEPSSPQVKVLTALSVLAGLLLGGALALLLNRLDDRFRNLEDLSEATGLIPLGAVPAVPSYGKAENALLDHVSAYPNSAASETIRSIRVNFKHAVPKAAKSLLVTSALPNDGKTTFAVALGQIAARDGQKVLVIDCDLRKPSLSASFEHTSSRGLEDVLAQTTAWQDVIVRDEDSGLFCLPARGGSASPQQLLETYRFQTLLAEADRAFDLVIIDSPPVMLVSDAIVLSKLVDAIVLVVSWKRTPRRAVQETLKRLQASGRQVGVVLSRIRGKMPAYQAYGGYEYYGT